jgi:hypothetical protein
MDENNENNERSRTDRVLDGAAGVVGRTIWGTGYCVGRVAPKVKRAAKALAETEFARFVSKHFADGYDAGYEKCLQKEAEKHARDILAMGGEGAKEAAVQFLARAYRLMGLDEEGNRRPA